MSVLINMEMPKTCGECALNYDSYACIMTGSRFFKDSEFDSFKGRLEDCPLIPVPPHGRLIDADAVKAAAMEDILGWEDAGCDRDDYRAFLANYIYDAPTIIPAELPKDEAPAGPYDLLYEEGGAGTT